MGHDYYMHALDKNSLIQKNVGHVLWSPYKSLKLLNMKIGAGLVPIWHQAICNLHVDNCCANQANPETKHL